ncbi:MAG: hypothetical protein J6D03_05605, partial [Clostridia bacterium]|nr:hypothetical protein [Clostridia bacterium]
VKFDEDTIHRYVVYDNIVMFDFEESKLPYDDINNNYNNIMQFEILKAFCWIFNIYLCYDNHYEYPKYSIKVDKFNNLYKDKIYECELYDIKSNNITGYSQGTIEDIKFTCKLNGCKYKIIED